MPRTHTTRQVEGQSLTPSNFERVEFMSEIEQLREKAGEYIRETQIFEDRMIEVRKIAKVIFQLPNGNKVYEPWAERYLAALEECKGAVRIKLFGEGNLPT